MTALDKKFNQINLAYPEPLVDLVESGKKARAKIWGHRKNPQVREESGRIVKKHTRNSPKRKKTNQA